MTRNSPRGRQRVGDPVRDELGIATRALGMEYRAISAELQSRRDLGREERFSLETMRAIVGARISTLKYVKRLREGTGSREETDEFIRTSAVIGPKEQLISRARAERE